MATFPVRCSPDILSGGPDGNGMVIHYGADSVRG